MPGLIFQATISAFAAFLCFLIKIGNVALVCFIGYLWLEPEAERIPYFGWVLIMVAIFTYFITDLFTDVFQMAAESMMIVFLEDWKANGPSAPSREMIAPQHLRKIMMGKHLEDDAKDGDATAQYEEKSVPSDTNARRIGSQVATQQKSRLYPSLSTV